MISAPYRCVFVHIPKTGGTSIEQALGLFERVARGVQDHRRIGKLRDALGPADFADYFKFAFVRNPWDRVASWYKNVLRDQHHREDMGVAPDCSLRDFLTDHGTVWGMQTQLHWIREPSGAIPLDFIGRFERLREDFAEVCRRIGLDAPALPHLVRAPDATPYTALYEDASRAIVAERYAEEIEMFGYRFGG